MISESNTGIDAQTWFERLPSEQDRQMVTGVVAMAYEFDWIDKSRGGPFGCRYSLAKAYLGVYAIGSRAIMQEGSNSDIDLLVAHNLYFREVLDQRKPDYMKTVNFDLMRFDDAATKQQKEEAGLASGYKKASRLRDSFSMDCLALDPVANSISFGIAESTKPYSYHIVLMVNFLSAIKWAEKIIRHSPVTNQLII
jgi:hypothetical protein